MMNQDRLRRLLAEARFTVPEGRLIVFGSTSVFGAFPELAEQTRLYEVTLDSDFIADPWDDGSALKLQQAVGKPSVFFQEEGYYADIVRPAAFDQFPPGFQDRLVPIGGFENTFALEIHVMAVAKLWAGRPKDVRLLSALIHLGKLDVETLRKRLWDTSMAEKWIVKTHFVLDQVISEAKCLTDRGVFAHELRISDQ